MIGLNVLVPDILFESVGHFLWDEYVLPLLPAFRVSERQLSISDVSGSQSQNLADSHSSTGHQFQMRRFLGFSVLKMISSITSFSMMSQEVMGFALNIFRKSGVSQGLWKS